jgi:hypothetical protein
VFQRLVGALLLCLALAPRVASEGRPAAPLAGDQRVAVALAATDQFVGAPHEGGLDRNPDRRTRGHGHSSLKALSPSRSQPVGVSVAATTLLAIAASPVCRPYAERLPYHATAPPQGYRATSML